MAIKKFLHKLIGTAGEEAKANSMVFAIVRTGATYFFTEEDNKAIVLLAAPEPDLAHPAEQAAPGDLTFITSEQILELESVLHDDGETYDMQTPHSSETVRVAARFFI